MLYQRKLLSDGSDIGVPGELPAELRGLADVSLADLSWADDVLGYSGHGFVPVALPPVETPLAAVSPLAFRQLFTTAERIAIRTAAKTNTAVEDWLDLASVATEIHLDAAATVTGVGALETAGLIEAGRAAAILAGTAPA